MAKKTTSSSSSVETESRKQTFMLIVDGRDRSVTASSLEEAYEMVGLNKDGTQKVVPDSKESKTDELNT